MRCSLCKRKLEQTIIWKGGTGNVVVTEPYDEGPEVTMGKDDVLTGAKSYNKRLSVCKECAKK